MTPGAVQAANPTHGKIQVCAIRSREEEVLRKARRKSGRHSAVAVDVKWACCVSVSVILNKKYVTNRIRTCAGIAH